MRALSILQPYAWLIVHGHKDIENRTWHTALRERIIIHAGKKYSRRDHQDYTEILLEDHGIQLPCYEQMPRGAIVGAADLIDCVREHSSRWKNAGTWGFVLANSKACEPVPYRGQLGFFEISHDAGVVELFSAPTGDSAR